MKITITTLTDLIFTLDVSEDLELENFKVFCEVESGFPAGEIVISFNGVLLSDEKKSLKDYGVADGDVVVLQHMAARLRMNQGAPSKFLIQSEEFATNLFRDNPQIWVESISVPLEYLPLQPVAVTSVHQ